MSHKAHDVGVSKHIGKYSDAIEVAPALRWLHTSGTPGLADDGALPKSIEEQTRLAWRHIFDVLEHAGMTKADIVKVTTSLTSADLVPAYVKVRSELLGDIRPAFMLSIVSGLIWPGVLVEVEIIAAAR
jgi:2-iminobutanoate/2-iminopropanoate deaminase